MQRPSAVLRDSRGAAVTPLVLPSSATTIQQARGHEQQFLERFQRSFARVKRVYSPLDKCHYTLAAADRVGEWTDPYPVVANLMKEARLYDSELLESLPHNRSLRFIVRTRSLLGRRKPRVAVVAASRSPLARLARTGGAIERLDAAELHQAIREQLRAPGVYHVLGLLSTVGWSHDVTQRVPRGEDFAVVLIEPAAPGGWKLYDSLPKPLGELRAVFEPEEHHEKVTRVLELLRQVPELRIPGGHVEIEALLNEFGVDDEVLDEALRLLSQEESRIKRVAVSGRPLLKRDRY
ncbi:MAG: hypothetical protein ACKVX7_00355 [Planctomycetota bacterium]